jgi:ribosomal subunit interface protein
MNIQFSGQNYEITETEKEQIADGLAKLERHLGTLDAVHVYFSKVRHLVNAEIHISSRTVKLIGTGSTRDALISIDEAIDHLIKQSARFKKKRQDSRTNGKGNKGELSEGEATPTPIEKEQQEEPIVKRSEQVVRPMTLEEAIQELGLTKAEFFIFKNPKTNRVSVLYHRKDKTLGLIET